MLAKMVASGLTEKVVVDKVYCVFAIVVMCVCLCIQNKMLQEVSLRS